MSALLFMIYVNNIDNICYIQEQAIALWLSKLKAIKTSMNRTHAFYLRVSLCRRCIYFRLIIWLCSIGSCRFSGGWQIDSYIGRQRPESVELIARASACRFLSVWSYKISVATLFFAAGCTYSSGAGQSWDLLFHPLCRTKGLYTQNTNFVLYDTKFGRKTQTLIVCRYSTNWHALILVVQLKLGRTAQNSCFMYIPLRRD
jgi:hypothetical protein